jgi:ATP-binding protein involved in chromosome partitioning
MNSENIIIELQSRISNILDSDLSMHFSELDSIKNIHVSDSDIDITIELISPYHLIKESIFNDTKEILNSIAPTLKHNITIVEKSINIKNRNVLNGVKNIIAIASGKGGVGKSSIAANIAISLAKTRAKVGILDADIYGPSQPTMFGLVNEPMELIETEDGKALALPNSNYGVEVVSMGFMMNPQDAAIVRGPMLASYFSMLFEQVKWSELDILIIDLPPGTGDIQLTMTQKLPLTGAVIITTPQEISLIDVRRSIAMFNKVDVNILGIVENMSYFSPENAPDKIYYIFGEGGGKRIAGEYFIELLGELPINIEMQNGNDKGKPIVVSAPESEQTKIFKDITKKLIKQIRKANFKQLDTKLEIEL